MLGALIKADQKFRCGQANLEFIAEAQRLFETGISLVEHLVKADISIKNGSMLSWGKTPLDALYRFKETLQQTLGSLEDDLNRQNDQDRKLFAKIFTCVVSALEKIAQLEEYITARHPQSCKNYQLFRGIRDASLTVENVRDLIKNGAEVNAFHDEDRMTCLMAAADRNKPEIIKLLVASGSWVDAEDNSGKTALMYAAYNLEAVEVLVSLGADVNVKHEDSLLTPLMLAANAGASEVVDALIRAGADLNAHDSSGETALIHALCTRDLESVKMLIKAGADIQAALDFSCVAGKMVRSWMCSNLLVAFTDLNLKDTLDETTLHYLYMNSNSIENA